MDRNEVVCLVAAAGRGLRFDRETPKSFHLFEGRSLLARTVEALSACARIDRFVVMVPPGWEEKAIAELPSDGPGARITVVTGGETRQESVQIGLENAGDAEIVLIHDAARPFVSSTLIERVIAAARETGAAVPALLATDTLGRLRGEELEAIVPRDRVVGVQTPQGFRTGILKRAYEASSELISESTDESSLVLAANMPVKVVDGER
ncbi:MAG TPA: IspD/TarI family cytidylyltransferase, partial [Candidatus Krumholzibacterium sp.]|nr:IspD/TarI family cytidylyltransferase [Candidatus Krumholzibacterium sp.]